MTEKLVKLRWGSGVDTVVMWVAQGLIGLLQKLLRLMQRLVVLIERLWKWVRDHEPDDCRAVTVVVVVAVVMTYTQMPG